jgi:branched-chain amino acid transport system ATP-binding protein
MIWLQDMREVFGITLLIIEHDMRLVMEVSDSITVLNFGQVIAQGDPAHVQAHPEVLKAYLGEDGAAAGVAHA